MVISYLVGGICEGIFASLYGHEIARRIFSHRDALSLILPPTIPYWMVALRCCFRCGRG